MSDTSRAASDPASRRRRGSAQPPPAPAASASAARRRGSSASVASASGAGLPPPQTRKKSVTNGVSAKPAAGPGDKKAGTQSKPGDVIELVVAIAGARFPVHVPRHWPCEALVDAAIAEYQALYPGMEPPDCNQVFHGGKQAFLIASETIGSCCMPGDDIELTIARAAPSTVSSEQLDAASDAGSVGAELPPFEFAIKFHHLPLGFTMKQSNGQTVVANLYPKTAAMHYRRLVSGVVITEIAGSPLASLGLRQVHEVMKSAQLPFEIRFRGHVPPPTVVLHSGSSALGLNGSGFPTPGAEVVASSPRSSSSSKMKQRTRSNSSGRRGSGRSRRGSAAADSSFDNQLDNAAGAVIDGSRDPLLHSATERQQPVPAPSPTEAENDHSTRGSFSSAAEIQAPLSSATAVASNQQEGESEEVLAEHVKQLQFALLRKHEEAKEIARQLQLCEAKLQAVRASHGSPTPGAVTPPSAPASAPHIRTSNGAHAGSGPPHSVPRSASSSSLRLTPEILEAMDKKAGLPSKGAGYYTSSNISSVSGYSNRSSHRGDGMRQPRSARYSGSNADNVSVSSHTSGVERRGSYPAKSPRGTALQNINKRYNYIPQKYSANEAATSTLSTRGAVISRARSSRDSFITKSDSPGVGYYDVKVVERVKGGEIGDADRMLPWS
jgi:hypothetical protein